jgi:hypothetical protein
MQEPDVRIDPRDDLTIQFEHQSQDAVSRGMLRPEIYREITEILLGHGYQLDFAAFSSPGRT